MSKHIHLFERCDKEGYERCVTCGTYHSIVPIDVREIYEGEYWDGDFRNTPDHQFINLNETETCGISKADKVMKYVPTGTAALEIGCFPGAILSKLTDAGYTDVWGIEPAYKYIPYILGKAQKAQIINGYFPEVTYESPANYCDVIIFIDVFEHIEDYDSFLNEVKRLLKPGGTAICMSPMILEDGKTRDRDFIPEHLWIHSKSFLDEYLKSMFSTVTWDRWIEGHDMFIVTK